jgi:hypothetical protein
LSAAFARHADYCTLFHFYAEWVEHCETRSL